MRGSWVAALLLAGACAGPSIDRRFEDFEERMAELTSKVHQCQAQASSIADPSAREDKLLQFDAVMKVIVLARAAGSLAYLTDDPRSLARTEQQVEDVVAKYPELAERSAATGSRN